MSVHAHSETNVLLLSAAAGLTVSGHDVVYSNPFRCARPGEVPYGFYADTSQTTSGADIDVDAELEQSYDDESANFVEPDDFVQPIANITAVGKRQTDFIPRANLWGRLTFTGKNTNGADTVVLPRIYIPDPQNRR